MNLQPKMCNICGEESVIFTSNKIIYGKEYGSGKCYYCTECGAYVGTHKPRPTEALGLLANKEMRDMKMKCHDIFDAIWKEKETRKEQCQARNELYVRLAKEMSMDVEECHFGWFDIDKLNKAYNILLTW